jgi:carboxymethylenebutenolidase
MNEIQRYLAEEIAIDCSNGHISRLEALRRFKVMGLSAAVAAALLSACGGSDGDTAASTSVEMNEPGNPGTSPSMPTMQTPSEPSMPATANPTDNPSEANASEGNVTPVAPPEMAAPGAPSGAEANPAPTPGPEMAIPTQAITFAGPRGVLQGAWASAAEPRGAVLVIHENRGLNDHIRSVAGRFAAAGYSALALDLLSEEGGTAALGDVANATAALSAAGQNPERFVDDMRAAVDELERRVPGAAIGAIGFCFGGGMMWRLVASGDPRLAAVAPFYGPLPQGAEFGASTAAVLGVYAELDARVNATREAADAALTAAGLEHEIVTFPGANHAFFNDTGMNYNAAAAQEAWTRVLAWFEQHLE